jgi:16S rRNA (cytosine1402-N4)-methyltransferase
MRFDPESSSGSTAAELVNTLPPDALEQVIRQYGEERQARTIARAIVETRARQPIKSVGDLVSAIARVTHRRGRLHPATRTFQALRLAVNDELGRLQRFLPQAVAALMPGGRLAVISFHSLEDRIVKQFFRKQAADGQVRILTKHPAAPGFAEVTTNPRSRSAKLRVAVRTHPRPLPLVD